MGKRSFRKKVSDVVDGVAVWLRLYVFNHKWSYVRILALSLDEPYSAYGSLTIPQARELRKAWLAKDELAATVILGRMFFGKCQKPYTLFFLFWTPGSGSAISQTNNQ